MYAANALARIADKLEEGLQEVTGAVIQRILLF